MIYAAKSIQGQREHNEDSVFTPKGGEISLAIIADGMGGHNAGDVASALAVETVVAELKRGGPGGAVALLTNAVNKSNTAVYEHAVSDANCKGMGTTLVAALLFKSKYVAANVGDSRLYHFSREGLHQVTKDHSYVAELVAAGYITEEEARRHPRRNIITRAIGTRPVERVDIYECDWVEDDILLLCTDGLYSCVTEAAMTEVLSRAGDLSLACEELVNMAFTGGSTDNISIVVVKNGEVAQ